MNLYQMSISMNLFLQDRTAGRPKIVFFSTYHIKLLRTNTHWSLKTEEKMFKFYSLFQNSGIKVLSPNCLSINVSYIYMRHDIYDFFWSSYSTQSDFFFLFDSSPINAWFCSQTYQLTLLFDTRLD